MKAIFIVNLREIWYGDGLPKVITLNNNDKVKTFLFSGGEAKLGKNEILLIKELSSIKKITDYPTNEADAEHEIIIIRDDADNGIFNNTALFKNACVVYHEAKGNTDVGNRTTLWEKDENVKSSLVGQHEEGIPCNPYNLLNDVFTSLEDDSSNFDELIGKIEKQICPDKKLEAVLEFLHLCLNDKIEDDYLKILTSAGIEVGNGNDGSIKALFEKVNPPGKNTTKNQELAALRDALLAKVGIV